MSRIPRTVFVLAALVVLTTGLAMADSLTVNNTAAMGGTGTACGGSNCGLDVDHDNSSVAYVQDDSPNDEQIYRASFIFNPNSISPGSNLRQTIFVGQDLNPNTGAGVCGTSKFMTNFRCFAYMTGGAGQNYSILCFTRGNLCGESAILQRQAISENSPNKVCVEYEIGTGSLGGRLALAVVSPATGACPTSGTSAWAERTVTNSLYSGIDFVRLGTPQTNFFGVGEDGHMYYDEFESFRTLAP